MEEKKKAGFSSAREKDIISKLPDSLISQILLYLPTKEAVRTSVLSSRWKSLWLLVPRLDLDSHEFSDRNAFASFINRFVDFSREEKSCLHRLKLVIREDEGDVQSCVTRLIDSAMPKLEHLDVECPLKLKCLGVMPMPVSLFTCETLLYMNLRQASFGSFEESSVSLPRLKTMRLTLNIYANERSLELLILSSPVLEDLSIVRREDDHVKVLRVRSQTLTSLSIKYKEGIRDAEELVDYGQMGVLIDAPRLECLSFNNEISATKTISNSGSLTKVNIRGPFDLVDDDQVRKLFISFSGVKDLKISYHFFLFLDGVKDRVPLPQFCNLSCLEAEVVVLHVETLLTLLASCPNLRSLVLGLIHIFVEAHIVFLPVPLSSLEFVEIKSKYRRYPIVELARYFAENSVILKKLVVHWGEVDEDEESEENPIVLSDILALPTRSSTCQIIVC